MHPDGVPSFSSRYFHVPILILLTFFPLFYILSNSFYLLLILIWFSYPLFHKFALFLAVYYFYNCLHTVIVRQDLLILIQSRKHYMKINNSKVQNNEQTTKKISNRLSKSQNHLNQEIKPYLQFSAKFWTAIKYIKWAQALKSQLYFV